MEQHTHSGLEIQLERVEERLRLFQIVSALGAVVLAVAIYLVLRPQLRNDHSRNVLRGPGPATLTALGLRTALFFTRSCHRILRAGLGRILLGLPAPNSTLRRSFDKLDRETNAWIAQAKLTA